MLNSSLRKKRLLQRSNLLIIAACLTIFSCKKTDKSVTECDASILIDGGRDFKTNCASCHVTRLERNFKKEATRMSDEEFIECLSSGETSKGISHIIFNKMSRKELLAIKCYLRSEAVN
jgi:hypothetical protein